MNLDRYFDDIPCSLGKREEPVFQKMVRCLQEKPDFALEMSQFGRIFSGAKQVLLKLFLLPHGVAWSLLYLSALHRWHS